MNAKKKYGNKLKPYLLVLLSFAGLIVLGSFLLELPISYTDLKWGDVMDSIFTATSAVCVTGLSTIPDVGATFSWFGILIIAILIQIGGLGFITIFVFIITILGRKLGFKDKYTIQQAISFTSIQGVTKFVKAIIFITLGWELLGFLLNLIVFIPYCINNNIQIGMAFAYSAFHSISAFNNAGFDLFGSSSLQASELSTNVLLNINTIILIIAGGLSFLTYMDIGQKIKRPTTWTVYTKIVLITTAILLVVGSVGFFLFQYWTDHPMTIMQAIFESVTCRTAGFSTFNQADLSIGSRGLACILMFIGASPVSTGGGVKTTTLFIIVYTIIRYIGGKQVSIFNRRLSQNMIIRAMSLVMISAVAIVACFLIISSIEKNNEVIQGAMESRSDMLFECFSAFGTVGLSTGITPLFSLGSKIVLCLLMFFGRLGPMTLISVFSDSMNKHEKQHYQLIEENFMIG